MNIRVGGAVGWAMLRDVCLLSEATHRFLFQWVLSVAFHSLSLCHQLHDCDCQERGKWDVDRDGGMAPELDRAEK